jgi:hypothetical protein
VSSRPRQRTCPPTPAETHLRAGASQKPKRALACSLSTLEIVRNVLRREDVTPAAPYHNGQSSFSFIDVPHSHEMERFNLFGWQGLEIELDCAGFAEFFFHTRWQAGNWRGAGVRKVQRAVDTDCSKGLLSLDAAECTWCPEGLEF